MTLRCKVTSQKLKSCAILTSCAPYNLPQKGHRRNAHVEKLEQTIGFRKQPFPCVYLASSLCTQQFTEIISFSWVRIANCHVTFLWISSDTSYNVIHSLIKWQVRPARSHTLLFRCKQEHFLYDWCRFLQQIPQIIPLSHAHITHSHIRSQERVILSLLSKQWTVIKTF